MTTKKPEDELEKLINKFAEYCACGEYHYDEINGRPGNHNPSDGHTEFDEDEFKKAILDWHRSQQKALLEALGVQE